MRGKGEIRLPDVVKRPADENRPVSQTGQADYGAPEGPRSAESKSQ